MERDRREASQGERKMNNKAHSNVNVPMRIQPLSQLFYCVLDQLSFQRRQLESGKKYKEENPIIIPHLNKIAPIMECTGKSLLVGAGKFSVRQWSS